MTRMVHCVKLGKEAEGLAYAPLPGPLGKKVYESVSKEAWEDWIRLQTMMVNEYQLNLADASARKHLLQLHAAETLITQGSKAAQIRAAFAFLRPLKMKV